MGTPALMAAFVYLDRFLAKFPKTRFREPMRPLVTCLVLGMKFTEDAVYSNDTWASLLWIPLATALSPPLPSSASASDMAVADAVGDAVAVAVAAPDSAPSSPSSAPSLPSPPPPSE